MKELFMNMKIKFILLYIIYAASMTTTELTACVINMPAGLDGNKKLGYSGHTVKQTLYIRKQIQKLLHGLVDRNTGTTKGVYYFNGQYHSVATLAKFELEHKNLSDNLKKELADLLEVAKNDFIKIAEPFVAQARGAKMITIRFIEEWAHYYNKKDCALLHWSKAKDGHEFDTFRTQTTSFVLLAEFCEDLLSFLADLVKSCPRAWEQFEELMKKQRSE